jgi:hypothetical protein
MRYGIHLPHAGEQATPALIRRKRPVSPSAGAGLRCSAGCRRRGHVDLFGAGHACSRSPAPQLIGTCVDAPFGARRIFGFSVARSQVLTCVRP